MADRNRFVDNGASAGGDGSSGSPYDDLAEAQTDEIAADNDLSGERMIFNCVGTTVDARSSTLTIDGWLNASNTDYIIIQASGTGIHDYTSGSGFSISCSAGTVFLIRERATRFGDLVTWGKGIEIISTSTGASDEGIRMDYDDIDPSSDDNEYIIGCQIRNKTTQERSDQDGVYVNFEADGSFANLHVINNLVTGWGRSAFHGQDLSGDSMGFAFNIYHNTFFAEFQESDGYDIGEFSGGDQVGTYNVTNNICASAQGMGFTDSGGSSQATWAGSKNITVDATHSFEGLTAGIQASDGLTATTKSADDWIVVESIAGDGEQDLRLKASNDNTWNKPAGAGADIFSIVGKDGLGTDRVDGAGSDCGFFEYPAAVGGDLLLTNRSIANFHGVRQ